jgi:hypothetical protein
MLRHTLLVIDEYWIAGPEARAADQAAAAIGKEGATTCEPNVTDHLVNGDAARHAGCRVEVRVAALLARMVQVPAPAW